MAQSTSGPIEIVFGGGGVGNLPESGILQVYRLGDKAGGKMQVTLKKNGVDLATCRIRLSQVGTDTSPTTYMELTYDGVVADADQGSTADCIKYAIVENDLDQSTYSLHYEWNGNVNQIRGAGLGGSTAGVFYVTGNGDAEQDYFITSF